jgi:hypothetical protein
MSLVIRQAALSPPPRHPLRLPAGAICEAAVAVLSEAREPLRPGDIRLLVEHRLDRPVSQDTVSSFLSVAARRAFLPIERVSRGLYVLRTV